MTLCYQAGIITDVTNKLKQYLRTFTQFSLKSLPYALLWVNVFLQRVIFYFLHNQIYKNYYLRRHNISQNMKKIITLALFAAVFFTSGTFAQTTKSKLGIEAGAGITSLRGNPILEKYQEHDVGFSSALFLQYNLKKTFSIHTSIGFERIGTKTKSGLEVDSFGNPLGNAKTYRHFNYLSMPLLLRASFGKKINFFVNAGPHIGILLNETSVTKIEGGATTKDEHTEDFNTANFGVTSGLGVSIPLNLKFDISFEARDNLGLSNINKVEGLNNATIKTNSLSLLVGLAYKL